MQTATKTVYATMAALLLLIAAFGAFGLLVLILWLALTGPITVQALVYGALVAFPTPSGRNRARVVIVDHGPRPHGGQSYVTAYRLDKATGKRVRARDFGSYTEARGTYAGKGLDIVPGSPDWDAAHIERVLRFMTTQSPAQKRATRRAQALGMV